MPDNSVPDESVVGKPVTDMSATGEKALDYSTPSDIARTWARHIFEDGVPAVELIVETTIETRPDAPGYDRARIDAVVQAALRMDTAGNYDRIIVEPARV